jgi:hypothetical protein
VLSVSITLSYFFIYLLVYSLLVLMGGRVGRLTIEKINKNIKLEKIKI